MRLVIRQPLPARSASALDKARVKLETDLAAGLDPPIGSGYKTKGIQKVLRDAMFEGCCAFCAAETEGTNYGQVEHHRPKGLPPFKSLAYTWTNLTWACGRCNQRKLDRWSDVTPPLDPCVDDPTQHLSWSDARAMALTPSGQFRIDLVDLNGDAPGNLKHYEIRRDRLEAVRLAWAAAAGTDPGPAAMARTLLTRFLGPGGPHRGMLTALGFTPANIP